MRITVKHIFLKSALYHCVNNMLTHLFRAVLIKLVSHKSFFNNLAYCKPWVKAGIRILEDYLKILTKNAHFIISKAGKIDTFVKHRLILLKFLIIGIVCFYCRKLFFKIRHNLIVLFKLFFVFYAFLVSFFKAGFGFCISFGIFFSRAFFKRKIVDFCKHFAALFILFMNLKKKLKAFFIFYCIKSADNLYSVVKICLFIASCKVSVLKKVEICRFFTDFINFIGEFLNFMVSFFYFFAVFIKVSYSIFNIFRCHIIKSSTVINSIARSLRIELEQDAPKC